MDSAIPCGLIINELLSNSLKYAFPAGRRGKVGISMRQDENHQIRLEVSDDGVGLPEGVGFSSTKSLGLRLVRTLADQLGAAVEMGIGSGTRISLTFQAGGNR